MPVLVVDDHPDTLTLFETFLTLDGFRVIAVANGIEGLRRAVNGVRAVVTDLAMPGMDGAELVRRIRTEAPQCVPIIAVTGQVFHPDALTREDIDCCRLFQKPVDVRQLADTLRFLIHNCPRDCSHCPHRVDGIAVARDPSGL